MASWTIQTTQSIQEWMKENIWLTVFKFEGIWSA